MQKRFNKTRGRDAENAARVKRTAILCRVSRRTVERVIQGEQVNDQVLSVYMQLSEGETELIKRIKRLVPIN